MESLYAQQLQGKHPGRRCCRHLHCCGSLLDDGKLAACPQRNLVLASTGPCPARAATPPSVSVCPWSPRPHRGPLRPPDGRPMHEAACRRCARCPQTSCCPGTTGSWRGGWRMAAGPSRSCPPSPSSFPAWRCGAAWPPRTLRRLAASRGRSSGRGPHAAPPAPAICSAQRCRMSRGVAPCAPAAAPQEYVRVFGPLLLEECAAQLLRGQEEGQVLTSQVGS